MLDYSYMIARCALARTECRGAHWRLDHPGRNDKEWLKHTLAWLEGDEIRLDYKPVVITRFQPEERKLHRRPRRRRSRPGRDGDGERREGETMQRTFRDLPVRTRSRARQPALRHLHDRGGGRLDRARRA